jgi:ECF sigma factor
MASDAATAWRRGAARQPGAGTDALFLELYQELRRIARARLRRGETITLLDTTGLVHESYLAVPADGACRRP